MFVIDKILGNVLDHKHPVSDITGIPDLSNVQEKDEKSQPNGYASLGADGKVPTSELNPIAITSTFVVNSQAAQLALTTQEGDVAVRTDLSKTYIHNGGTAGTMADWTELATPTNSVLSVNSKTGAVTLTTADIADSSDKRYLTDAQQTALHSHTNKALLDTYAQTEANLADAVSKRHTHANSAALDAVSGTNTGDQDLSGLMSKTGGTFTGDVDIERSGTAASLKLVSFWDTTTNGSSFVQQKARGTRAVPLAVQNNDRIMLFAATGYDGSAFPLTNSVAIAGYVDGTIATNSIPSKMVFEVTKQGDTLRTGALTIKNDGNVGIANTSPEEKLHVGGAIAISRGAFNSFISGATIHDPRIYASGAGGSFPFNETGTLVIQPRVSSATGSRIAFVTNNGTAVDTRMTILSNGNVGIGNTNPLAALDLGTGSLKTVNTNIVETYLEGTGLRMKNIYTGAGWARNLLTFEDSAGTDYFGIGALGTGQTFNYLFIGPAYNDTWMVFRNTNVGIGDPSPDAKLDVSQSSTTAAIPVLQLEQLDVSEEFIEFTSTSAADNTNPISTTAVGTYAGKLRINVNGTYYWLPYYNS